MTYVNEKQLASSNKGPTAATSKPYIYFDESAAAKYLGFQRSSRRLKDLRQGGGGPRYVRIGAAVRYRSDWLDTWAETNAVSSTSEEAARRRE